MSADLPVVEQHLSSIAAALAAGTAPPPVSAGLLDAFALRLSCEPADSTSPSTSPHVLRTAELLLSIVSHPRAPSVEDPDSVLVESLAAVSRRLSLTQAAELAGGLLQQCLQPGAPAQLQRLAVDTVARASSAELRGAHDDLVAPVFQAFASAATDVGVVSAIERLFDRVVSLAAQEEDPSVFRQVFTGRNVRALSGMKSSGDSVLLARLVDLDIKLFSGAPRLAVADEAVFDSLYLFADSDDFLQNDDAFYLNKLVSLHAVIFDRALLPEPAARRRLVAKLSRQISYLFQLYAAAAGAGAGAGAGAAAAAAAGAVGAGELVRFLANFSFYSPADFHAFNEQSHRAVVSDDLLARNNPARLPDHLVSLLSRLNPAVLAPYNLASAMASVSLTNHHLPVYAQWTAFEPSFHSVKQNLSISKISSLTPTNALILLRSAAAQRFSASYLANEVPAVLDMYLLSDGGAGGAGSDASTPIDFATQKNYRLNQLRIEVIDSLTASLSTLGSAAVLVTELKRQRARLASGDVYGAGLEPKATVESAST